jgi:hypothetical protein
MNASEAKMDLKTFIEKQNIPYAFAWYMKTSEGEKMTIIENSSCKLDELEKWRETSRSMFKDYCYVLKRNLRKEEKKDCQRVFSLFLKHDPSLVCIDCDDKNIQDPDELGKALGIPAINNSMCWTKGNTKGFHIYVRDPNFNRRYEGIKVFGPEIPVDIIKYVRNVWEDENKIIYNAECITELNLSEILIQKKRKVHIEESTEESANESEPKLPKLGLEQKEFQSDFHRQCFVEFMLQKAVLNQYFANMQGDYAQWIKIGYALIHENISCIDTYWLIISQQLPDDKQSTNLDKLQTLRELQRNVEMKVCTKAVSYKYILQLIKDSQPQVVFSNFMTDVQGGHVAHYRDQYYKKTKEEFEANHFQFYGRIALVMENFSLKFYNQSDAKCQYAHLNFSCGKVHFNFINEWVEDKNKRQILKLVLRPDLPKQLECPKTYNTFQGYEIEKVGDIRQLLNKEEELDYKENNHIHQLIAKLSNYNFKVMEEIIQWVAHLIFAPQDMGRFHTAMVFYSQTEGTGKSLFTQDLLLKKIIGTCYGTKTSKMDDLFGTFNDILENKVYVLLEEGKRKDGVEFSDVMKDSLVSDTLVIHKKGCDRYTTNNCVHMIINTNNETVVSVDNSNRRYFLIHTDENKLSVNEILLKKVLEDISSPDKCLQFVRYLYTKFDPSWNSEKYIVNEQVEHEHFKTHLQDQISQTDQFLLIACEDDEVRIQHKLTDSLKGLDLYKSFSEIMRQTNRPGVWSMAKFGREIKKASGVTSKMTKECRVYEFDFELIREYLNKKKLLE